jgi:outer membrane lipoprotein SlyB
MNPTQTVPSAPIPTQKAFSRPAAMIGAAAGLVALTALATTLALRAPATNDVVPGSAASMQAQPLTAAANPPTSAAVAATDAPDASVARGKPSPVASPDRGSAAATEHAATKPAHVQSGTVQPTAARTAAAACPTCGKVEAVTAVQKKGDGTGLGAVGGAVVGGLVGSQLGGGSGKGALTVLGALGGGVAGNEVEKRARATTQYQVRVRMDDGSLRTVTQGSAPAVGQKVTVEGSTIKARA